MNKIWFIALVSILLGTVSCSKDDPTDETLYTVSFDADGGSPVPSSQSVEAGKTATAPTTNPVKQNYVFLFWHLNGTSTAYNFQTPVNSNIMLKAKWEEKSKVEYWLVSWELNGGAWPSSGDNHATQVAKGGTLAEPNVPTKSGSTFDGWYKEAGFTNKVTFPATVTSDFKLYAKWKTASLNVYVAGYVENGKGNRVATVWKNTEKLYQLTDGEHDALTYSIYVSGNDVYVVGTEDNATGTREGRVWKNGQKLYSFTNGSQDVSAYSICISGNDVYVAGEMRPRGTTNFTGKVWKNGTELYSFNGSVSGMCINNNDIYVCGSNNSNAKVWKNGMQWWTSNVTNYSANAHCMYTSGGNIYVAMNFTTSTSVIIAKVNQGDTFTQLYSLGNLPNPSSTAKAASFAVSNGGDVYTAVNTVQRSGSLYITQARIYKNSTLLYEKGGEGKMYLFGNDVYHYRTYDKKTRVSKNDGELYLLINGASILDQASDIFVVEN